MRYCSRCIIPETRPEVELGPDGVCLACRAHGRRRETIDWDERRGRFEKLVERVRGLGRPYDCVIPVSGGKDSTWQMVTCLEHGLHPLAVTWRPPGRTEIGQENLDNLIALGVDHVDFSISPKVERKFLYAAMERYGAAAIPMHMAIFNVPVRIALQWRAPLVIWGENSAAEYSGTGAASESFRLDSEWLRRFGVVHGTSARDWVSDELSEEELTPYFGPTEDELAEAGVEGIFLGYFFEWDPTKTAEVARAHGFKETGEAKTGIYSFADIDDEFISIHHYGKWFKFGFTRTYDNLSLEIRNGRITRDEAIEVLRELGDETPHGDIDRFCSFLGISHEHFFELCERFRNTDIWKRRDDGIWYIEDFLIPDWPWDREPART